MGGRVTGQQNPDRVILLGFAQRAQETGDGQRVIEAGITGGAVGKGLDQVVNFGRTEGLQQRDGTHRVIKLGIGDEVRVEQGLGRLIVAGFPQRAQQHRDAPWVVVAGLSGMSSYAGGQGPGRLVGPGRLRPLGQHRCTFLSLVSLSHVRVA